MKMNILRAVTIIVALTFVISGCGKNDTKTSSESDLKKPVAVNVAKVTRTTVESAATLNGKVNPVKEVDIAAKTPGKVAKVNFDVGGKVRKGDVLFTLEDKDIRLQVKQSEAALSIAKASLSRTKGGSLEQQIAQLKNALVNAETSYNDSKLNYGRTKELYTAGAVSKQTFEGAETKYKLAEEQYINAKTNLELTQEKINPENIASAEAQLKQAQAAYEMAVSQLDNTVVRSPIDGVVAVKNVKAGEMTGAQGSAMTIVDLTSAVVNVGVTEDMINRIGVGRIVKVKVQAADQKPLEGKIAKISPIKDQKTQAYPVEIEISNNEGVLKGGMFAEIVIAADKADNVLAIPLAAVLDEDGRKVVYVVEGDTAKRREVTLGFISEKNAQIIDGLNENETVVVKGNNFLQDGSNIIITENNK